VSTSQNHISTLNRRVSESLANGATWTGEWENVTNFAEVTILVYSDQQITLTSQFTLDQGVSPVPYSDETLIQASTGTPHKLAVKGQWFRTKLTNNSGSGATVQLEVKYSSETKSELTKPLSSQVVETDEGLVVHSVIHGKTTAGGGSFVDVKVTPSGALTNDATISDISAIVGQDTKANSLPVTLPSDRHSVSTSNSSTASLSASTTFTGSWEDISQYSDISVFTYITQSATLYLDFSTDGVTTHRTISYTITASTGTPHKAARVAKYFRVRLTNNGVSTATVALQSILSDQPKSHLTTNLSASVGDYSDAELTRAVLVGRTDGGTYTNVPVTSEGHVEVAIHAPRLPFGSIHTEKLRPIFQCDGVYGINTGQVNTIKSGTGVATASDSLFEVSTGTTINSQAIIQSRKRLRYRPGEGSVCRFTAVFTSPVANSYQVVGLGHFEDGLFVGYVGTQFGILYSNRGVRETRTLTVATASSTTENVTVTLNGTAYSVAVTNSGNTLKTAQEIAAGTYSGWATSQVGSTVVFVNSFAGVKSGSYSLSGSTAAGTFAQTKAGVASSDAFVAQSSWNGDKLDGTGATGVTIDPLKLNVFQLNVQYLGAGAITVEAEVARAGNNPDWTVLHTFLLPNTLTTTTFGNPSFPFTIAAYSTGSTTNLTVKCGSFAGFIEGEKILQGNRFSYGNTKTTVASGSYVPLFTIKNELMYNGRTNQSIVNILSASGGCDHTKQVILYLIKNGTLSGNPNFSSYSTISTTTYDTAATGVTFSTNEKLVWSGSLGINGSLTFAFSDDITLQPGEWITLACQPVSGTATSVNGSINTREDQ